MYYAGISALTGFVKNLFTIRGEYEMIERSMGALLGDFSKGNKLFNEIQTQALKSPFTVLDLSASAKQLIAYNFAESEVVETTKRLADISSALGVPMERIVYNLGQIKAQGALTARDARDFANAGLAIVPMLAKMYTETKKYGDNLVTTADVYDMMSKKMVTYGDVMQVIGRATNEGGMFFDFQAKQAETLKGQLSNLVDAYNLMLNQIGESEEGIMKNGISMTKTLFAHWKTVYNTLLALIGAYGIYKTVMMSRNALMGKETMYITQSVIANKAKIASDLERERLTRALTTEEIAFLANRKKVTIADYAAILASKTLRKEQATLLAMINFRNKAFLEAMVRSGQLTAAEVRGALSTKGLSLAWNVAALSAKSLGTAVWGLVKSFLPMLAISAVVGYFMNLKQKSDDLKESLGNVNDQYRELKKSFSDITVGFDLAISKKSVEGLDEAKKKWMNLLLLQRRTLMLL